MEHFDDDLKAVGDFLIFTELDGFQGERTGRGVIRE